MSWRWALLLLLSLMMMPACRGTPAVDSAQGALLDADNPVRPIPDAPRGLSIVLSALAVPPTAERVRLGRWLFFDKRMSKDSTISCATCHRPEHAFSQPTPVATGIAGMIGKRK